MNVQERLQLKRIPLDKWSNREQLCLAMAVLCSGDQNWMSVSRALKMMCGTNRPTDWFSQKFCAAQYGKLLENVETPKRKKRTATERDNPEAATTIIPGELIVRKLVQERTGELKKLVEEEQREYRQLASDIRLLQSDTLDEAQVLAMWDQIELENREKEQEQQKHALWLREREEKKIEMERAWRPGAVLAAGMSPTSNSNSSGSPSRNSPSLFLKTTNLTPKAEPMEQEVMMATPDTPLKQGTSPLLTSLLKSPSSNPGSANIITPGGTPRSLAPTITNLLTGGQQLQPQQPHLATQNVPNSSQSFFNFHSQHPQHQQAAIVTQPSKAAPTLSKLLDPSNRNKGAGLGGGVGGGGGGETATVHAVAPAHATPNITTDDDVINIDDDQQLMEVFKELMPDDLADILTGDDDDNNEMIVSPELLDHELEHVPELMPAGSTGQGGMSVEEPKRETLPEVKVEVKLEEPINVAASKNDQAEGTGFAEEQAPAMTEKTTTNEVNPDTNEKLDNQTHQEDTTTGTEVDVVVVVSDSDPVEVTDDDDMMELDDIVTPTDQNEDNGDVHLQEAAAAMIPKEEIEAAAPDNLEEQLAAITNGAGGDVVVEEVKQEVTTAVEDPSVILSDDSKGPETILSPKDEIPILVGTPEVTQSPSEEKVKVPEEEIGKDAEEDELKESDHQEGTNPPLEALQATADDNEADDEKETESEHELTEPTAITDHSEQNNSQLINRDEDLRPPLPPRDERKVSTDNEDQFEDAKSTMGDSGNLPEVEELEGEEEVEDVEMRSLEPGKESKPVADPMVVEKEKEANEGESGIKNPTPIPIVVDTPPPVTTSKEDTNPPPETSASTSVTPFDRSSRSSKRDMPRRNRSQTSGNHEHHHHHHHQQLDSGEETKSSSSASTNVSLRARLKERERSESPLVGNSSSGGGGGGNMNDDDTDTSDLVIPRTRRRYSSTPVIDSVPSSPASGDDREYKNWKKTVLIAFNQFSTLHYKYSAVLVQQVPEEFRHIILRPMDMQTIKKNIESGVYRSTMEFQRDILLMVQNAVMMNTRRDRDWTNLINDMMVEVDYWKRETEKNLSQRESDGPGAGGAGGGRDGQGKVRNRKSMRITMTAA